MRLRVCKVVEIQAAWRGYVERKKLIRLKQAAIILQAHWRGRSSRTRYIQWNLRTRDTLGLIVLSLVERLSLSRR